MNRVGYRKKYRVAGWVRVPAGHCWEAEERGVGMVGSHIFDNNIDLTLLEKWVFCWFGGIVGDIVENGRLRCFTRSVGQSELHQFPDWSLNLPDSSASIAPKSSNR